VFELSHDDPSFDAQIRNWKAFDDAAVVDARLTPPGSKTDVLSRR
jgi:hypothetical protein